MAESVQPGSRALWLLLPAVLLLTNCASTSGWYLGSGHAVRAEGPQPISAADSEAALRQVIEKRLDRQVAELSKVARARRTLEGLVCDSDKLLFKANSSQLSPQGRQLLLEVTQILSKYPEDFILVGGHSDSIGDPAANARLSEERAIAIADALIDDGVLPMESVRVHGYGAEHPVAPNGTPEGRQMNRRVELVITVDQTRIALNR